MNAADISLVPPGRLGALLTKRRNEKNFSLAEMAKKSQGVFTIARLKNIEKGKSLLEDTHTRFLAELYELNAGPLLQSRSALILDTHTIGVGIEKIHLEKNNTNYILEKYLSLLYILRGMKPGESLPLRDLDLDTLAASLPAARTEIKQKLLELMGTQQVAERSSLLSTKIAIPSAGILVAVTALGSFIITKQQNPDESILSTPQVEQVETQISEIPHSSIPPSAPIVTTPATTTAKETTTSTSTESIEQPSIQELGAQAAALLNYPMEEKLPGWEIHYKSARPGYKGLTYVSKKTIDIYISTDDTPMQIAEVLAHEIGHAIDVTYLTMEQRNRWVDARDMPATWWPGDGLSDFHVGAGDYAEAVAAILIDSPSDSTYGEFTESELSIAKEFLP